MMNKTAYEELKQKLKYHMNRYYNEDEPEISDYEYDRLMVQLKEAEKEHPEWVDQDSPTQVIGENVVDEKFAASTPRGSKRTSGVVVSHDVPMLSIQDVFTKEDVLRWVHEVRSRHPDVKFSVEQKIDGLSMSIRYDKGKIVLAETRGDGLLGEDVTLNALAIPDVLQDLGPAGKNDAGLLLPLEIRGEVYMTLEAFEKTNERQELEGKKIFANPRNCAAGTLKQLDPRMVKKRGLSMFLFNMQRAEDETLMQSHQGALRRMKAAGFPIVPSVLCVSDEEILAQIDAIGASRGELSYDIDGAVVKIDQIAYREDFPAGSKYSAGHIAYKYPPEEKEAVIQKIELSVGMTGRINPTAVFTPIRLCGTAVSRATLHNQDFINRLGIGIGDTVLVYKSGEIIPKIRSVVREKHPEGGEVYQIPSVCPVCGGRVEREAGSADMFCTNEDCPAKLIRRVIHFVSRDAMDLKGFGAEYIQSLIEGGYLRNIADLYSLKDHRSRLIQEGVIGKEKNTDKLLAVIERSKQNEPYRLLCGLAIANVGKEGAKTLMHHFHSFDALREAGLEDLLKVPDVGETTARGILNYFAGKEHQELLERLKKEGVRMEEEKTLAPGAEQPLAGKKIVITGALSHFLNREELISFIEERGGKVSGSVSGKTDFLINNDKASTSGKNKKAIELGIPILSEDDFLSNLAPEKNVSSEKQDL